MRGAVMASVIAASMSLLPMRAVSPVQRLHPQKPIEPDDGDLKMMQKAQEKRNRRAAKALKGMK